jgi:hypothetical protein
MGSPSPPCQSTSTTAIFIGSHARTHARTHARARMHAHSTHRKLYPLLVLAGFTGSTLSKLSSMPQYLSQESRSSHRDNAPQHLLLVRINTPIFADTTRNRKWPTNNASSSCPLQRATAQLTGARMETPFHNLRSRAEATTTMCSKRQSSRLRGAQVQVAWLRAVNGRAVGLHGGSEEDDGAVGDHRVERSVPAVCTHVVPSSKPPPTATTSTARHLPESTHALVVLGVCPSFGGNFFSHCTTHRTGSW